MKYLITTIILICSLTMSAQTKIYKGNSTSYSDCLYTLSGDKIYRGNSTSYSDCLYTISNDKIYRGNSTSYSDCLYTIKGNKIYKGNSTSYSDCLYTLHNEKSIKATQQVIPIVFLHFRTKRCTKGIPPATPTVS